MQLCEGQIYHVYNRGNNRRQVFFNDEHYMHFLRLMQKTIASKCDILAWCLMPNHFHLLIAANHDSVGIINDKSFPRQRFSQEMKQLLSSYTKALNKQMGFTGSIFQQKTKAICVNTDAGHSYAATAFHYIHQNPLKAGLVSKMEDWEFSSFKDHIGLRHGRLCNKALATAFLDIDPASLYRESYMVISNEKLKNIMAGDYY